MLERKNYNEDTMLQEAAKWLVDAIFDMGYGGITLLMAVESSFIPFPSEVVLVPAGYLAYQGEMSIGLILLASLVGSLIGAFINYFGALWIGRRVLHRYGKYFFIPEDTLDKMEQFFKDHGPISTFTGRLIPGIRQLISVPAGLARMDLKHFVFYTSAGVLIWSAVLVAIGYFVGQNEALIKEYLKEVTIGTVLTVIVILGVYFFRNKKK
jgi:membrane protein DedA with SNARE-associated domain